MGTFRMSQHRLAQPLPDLPQEAAPHIKSLLPLQLAQVNVEIDLPVWVKRKITSAQPDTQVRALSVHRSRQRSLRPRQGKHPLSFGVLALPASLHGEAQRVLLFVPQGIRDTHVR